MGIISFTSNVFLLYINFISSQGYMLENSKYLSYLKWMRKPFKKKDCAGSRVLHLSFVCAQNKYNFFKLIRHFGQKMEFASYFVANHINRTLWRVNFISLKDKVIGRERWRSSPSGCCDRRVTFPVGRGEVGGLASLDTGPNRMHWRTGSPKASNPAWLTGHN